MTFKTMRTVPEEKKMIEDYKKGKTTTELAKEAGVSRQRMHQILRKYGVVGEGGMQVKRENRKLKYARKWTTKEEKDLYRAKRAKFRKKKGDAKKRGIDFLISYEDIEWPTHCPVFAEELNYFSDGDREFFPSFDRIDPKIGYVKGNVVIVSLRANRIKNDATIAELRQVADFYDNLTLERDQSNNTV